MRRCGTDGRHEMGSRDRRVPSRGISPIISALALLPFLIGGCALLSKPESTSFEAVNGGFAFRAIADAAYPEATPNGEAWRMRWLQQRLAETGTCPKGYAITSRKPVLLTTGTLGSIYDVYYEGRCTG